MEEVWKDVNIANNAFLGIYQISNKGRLKTMARKINMNGRTRTTKDRIVKGSTNGRYLSLCKENTILYVTRMNLLWDVFNGTSRFKKHVRLIDKEEGLSIENLHLVDYSDSFIKGGKNNG